MDEARYREAETDLFRSLAIDPTEHVVQLASTGTRVRVQELGAGPPILFLHGGSICGASWASLISRLDGFRCILFDRPGCGLSEPLPHPFADVDALERYADSLVGDVLDALSIDRAHVAATSFGGFLAIRSAAADPGRFDRLMLYGYPVGAPVGKTPLVMRIGGVPAVARAMTSIPPSKRMVRELLKGIGLRDALEAGRITPEMLGWFLSMLRDTDTMQNETRTLPRIITFRRGLNEDVRLAPELLARVSVPASFLWGANDPFGGADVARAFVAGLPDAELALLPNAGHAVWMDDADHAAAVTREFLGAGPR